MGERECAALAARREAVIGLVALTIAAGGFVAGLHAGLIYNTFPLMDGSFVPAGYAPAAAVRAELVRECRRGAVQPSPAGDDDGRRGAAAVAGGAARGAAAAGPPRLHALLAAAALQFALGVATLLLVVPVPLGAAHQAGAVLLLTAAIVFRHTLRRPRIGRTRRRRPYSFVL